MPFPIEEMARQAIDRFNLHVRMCSECADPPDPKLCPTGRALDQGAQDICAAKFAMELERKKALV